jgi:outer membrane beta-barrel protein
MRQVLRIGSCLVLTGATLMTPNLARSQAPEEGIPRNTEAVDRALELYWRTEQEFDTLVERMYPEDGRHEFTLSLGVVPNDEFYTHMALGLRWDLHVNDFVSLGLSGSATPRFASKLRSFLQANDLEKLLGTPPAVMLFTAAAQVTWVPFHGKLGVLTAKVAHFDFFLTGGLGIVGTQARVDGEDKIAVEFAGHLGAGLKFWLVDFITLGFGYRQFFHTAPDAVGLPAEFGLNVGFWTP